MQPTLGKLVEAIITVLSCLWGTTTLIINKIRHIRIELAARMLVKKFLSNNMFWQTTSRCHFFKEIKEDLAYSTQAI